MNDESTINAIINADLTLSYSQPVSSETNTTENATTPETNTTTNATDKVEEVKEVVWEIKKNGTEVFKKIEELNALNSSREFAFNIGDKSD